MKRFAVVLFLFTVMVLPSQISAEQNDTYLVYGSEQQIEQIKTQYHAVTKEFEELPLIEMTLSETDKKELQNRFSTAEIYPNREYETAADTVPPSFAITESTPKQTSPYTGKGVRVAVLDTGIDTEHPDLSVAGGVCTAAVCSEKVPYDDNFGHGTHVAGIIAAQKNNIGIIGVAPDVELFAIKSMNNRGAGSTAQITKGVEWAIQNDIDILNLSISIALNDRPLELMLQKAYQEGMLIVSAAGNEGGSGKPGTITYPGKFSSVIAVGAVNPDLTRETNSSTGPEMELSAPGSQIVSAYPKELDMWDDKADGYRAMSGTSMAAPHVTGILAIYKEQHPGLSNAKLREFTHTTAKDIGPEGRDETFGYGVVQYKKDITAVPFIKTNVNKGEIELSVANEQLVSDWSLLLDGEAVKEIGNGKWLTYKTAGTYPFTFRYTAQNGAKKMETVTIDIKEPSFPDVTMNSWFAPHISYLYSNDMINGYSDGTFKPKKEIKRSEALILIGKAIGLSGEGKATAFKDVGPHNTASGFIQSAYEKGIIAGFPDGTFRPDQSVTRAEMALLIQHTYKFDFNKGAQTPFTDVHSAMAAYEAIQAITQNNITVGYTATTFEPDAYMNRYSFSVFLAKSENQEFFE